MVTIISECECDKMNFEEEEKAVEKVYIELNDLVYSPSVLLFLRRKIDDFTIDCLRKIFDHRNTGGLHKTKIQDYNLHRKRYDAAILTLEVQGFIEHKQDGKNKPYFLTVRGRQLVRLLAEEKDQLESNKRSSDMNA